jgi:hypothetical protein
MNGPGGFVDVYQLPSSWSGRIVALSAKRRPSGTVVLRQILGDGRGIGVVNRRAECLDHLGDLGVPARRIEKQARLWQAWQLASSLLPLAA